MRGVLLDVRLAVRGLIQTRGFAATAILTLAVGIAAATAVFSLLDAVLLRPLPFVAPERLVSLHESHNGGPASPLSGHEVAAWREQNTVFDSVAAFMYSSSTLSSGGDPAIVQTLTVTANYFDVLGTSPRLGRSFAAGEDAAGGGRLVVLSSRLWHERFGGSESAVGSTIVLNNVGHKVIGVMPPAGDLDPDLWVPMDFPMEVRRVGRHSLFAFGRLKPGVPVVRAAGNLAAIARRLEREMPDDNTGHGVHVTSMHENLVGGVRRPILVAAGAVGFVLLIACANVAHLLLTRSVVRRREIAIRAALGATRGRIVRYLLTESLVLALAGGAAGVLLAAWVVDLLPAITAVDIPRLGTTAMNGRVLLASLGITLLTAILCGTAPAFRGSNAPLAGVLGGGWSTGPGTARIAGILALSELALALVLMIGAALMLQSFLRLARVDPGFSARNVLATPVTLTGTRHTAPRQRVAVMEELMQRIGDVPGVRAVGAASHLPLQPGDNRVVFQVEGRPAPRRGDDRRASLRIVAGDYFRAMEIPLRRGRSFRPADGRRALPLIRWFEQQPMPPEYDEPQAAPVAIVNEALARQFFGGDDPVGRRIQVLFSPWIEIVGVVGDVRHAGLAQQPLPELYLSHLQEPQAGLTVVVKSAGDPMLIAPTVRAHIRSIDRDLPLMQMRPMEAVLLQSLGRPRFDALLLGAFSAVALLLAMIGIYGVTAYAVGQRTREIGIRSALGATRSDVLRLVLGRALALTTLGIAAGLAGAFALTRVLERLLFEIRPTDTLTFAVVAAGLALLSLLASYIPARRAVNIDPKLTLWNP